MEDELVGCPGSTIAAAGKITLMAEVHNLDVYEKVKERLEGMTIHTVNDVARALVLAAQRRANRAEQAVMTVNEESRRQIDELQAKLSFVEAERDNYKAQAEALVQENAKLNETIQFLDMGLQSRS